ncbi:hypothetical protein CDAR_491531 [Caerostris darwini]|uniref:Ycf1 n=1 Tax=Caerostris darwini TaxID=1538125 RepID=A0AAV4X6U1_9ARAC|nr:hypothetical protein CDAR_491531 [Caerostris darwini]
MPHSNPRLNNISNYPCVNFSCKNSYKVKTKERKKVKLVFSKERKLQKKENSKSEVHLHGIWQPKQDQVASYMTSQGNHDDPKYLQDGDLRVTKMQLLRLF